MFPDLATVFLPAETESGFWTDDPQQVLVLELFESSKSLSLKTF